MSNKNDGEAYRVNVDMCVMAKVCRLGLFFFFLILHFSFVFVHTRRS